MLYPFLKSFAPKNASPKHFTCFKRRNLPTDTPLSASPIPSSAGRVSWGLKSISNIPTKTRQNTIVKTQPKNVKKDPFLTAFAPKNASPKHFSSFYMRNISTEIPLSASHTFSPAGRVWWVQSWVGTKFQVDWENRGPKVGTFENVAAPKTNVKVNHFA